MAKFDMNAMLKQAQQMQAQMIEAQEQARQEVVEASAGGGMVTVKANGGGEIVEIVIDPKAIDPDDPELLADIVMAAANEALRSASDLVESKIRGQMPDLGSLGLPGLYALRRGELPGGLEYGRQRRLCLDEPQLGPSAQLHRDDRGDDEAGSRKLRRCHVLAQHHRGESDRRRHLDRHEQRGRRRADEADALEEGGDREDRADERGDDRGRRARSARRR